MTGGISTRGGDPMEHALQEQRKTTAKLAGVRRRRPVRLGFAAIAMPAGYAAASVLTGHFEWAALGAYTVSALVFVLGALVLQRGAR